MDLIAQMQPHTPTRFAEADMDGALRARHDCQALLDKIRTALTWCGWRVDRMFV